VQSKTFGQPAVYYMESNRKLNEKRTKNKPMSMMMKYGPVQWSTKAVQGLWTAIQGNS